LLLEEVAAHTIQMTVGVAAEPAGYYKDMLVSLPVVLILLPLAGAALQVMQVLALVLPELLAKTLFLVL
jgi:hypothetical protein